jgi:hypothetical protein
MPCSARPAITPPAPSDSALTTEPAPASSSEISSRRRRPNWSPSREPTAADPAATSRNAVIAQPTSTGLPKSRVSTRIAP